MTDAMKKPFREETAQEIRDYRDQVALYKNAQHEVPQTQQPLSSSSISSVGVLMACGYLDPPAPLTVVSLKLCYQVIEGFTVPVRSFPDGVVGREKARLSSPTVVECSGQRDGAWVELSTGGWISTVLLEDGVTPILKQVEPAQQQEDQVAGGIFTFVSYGDDHEIGHQCQRDVKEWLAKWAE